MSCAAFVMRTPTRPRGTNLGRCSGRALKTLERARNRAMILVMAEVGLHADEILHLRPED
jgi:integrase